MNTHTMLPRLLVLFSPLLISPFVWAVDEGDARTSEYVRAVVRGAGLMPWQSPGVSEAETAFRAEVEARKDDLLSRARPAHPSFYSQEAIARAKENVANHDWAKKWLDGQIAFADEIVAKPEGWIAQMLPREAPSHAYGFTCPVCVGVKSQEGVGDPLVRWSHLEPDQFSCRECGTIYPNADYPETATLLLPRTGHRVDYYLNPAEQANPEDRTGALAWKWVTYPIHNSFTGIVRERKIGFMRDTVQIVAMAYLFTGDAKYARTTRDILVRFAECYRQWPYRDYWDTYADCDPLYAAWHDKALPIEWKRHLSERAFKRDSMEKAAMLQNYWGAGRVHPSTDAVSGLAAVIQAYDFTADALDESGQPVWSEEARRVVQRDLLLEWTMGAEPYIGGPGQAEEENNKSPRIYNAMAALGKCLGIPEYADVALRGYEKVRDGSFLFDGFSSESPSYTAMYLQQLLIVPETLHGYAWPDTFAARSGTVDLYAQDPMLRLMYRSVLDTLLPDGRFLPLSDTRLPGKPPLNVVQMGTRRYPEYYRGLLSTLYRNGGDEYAVFNLTDAELTETQPLPLAEMYHPAWKTAVLRSGTGTEADTLTLALNPTGGHRHYDNLALFYAAGKHTLVGDLGYLGDMPVNKWIRSTASHNLVIVDGQEQEFTNRKTDLKLMATSPLGSVVEATSTAYPQCAEYRRRVVLVKTGPDTSFAVDIFWVTGGGEHRFRTYSELAASDATNGALEFSGVELPPEAPLPQVGASLAEADIFGLRDVRNAIASGPWQATWREDGAAYRLWMLTPDTTVEASNGPGQRTHEEIGRRVRYVDTVRRGTDLSSGYIAIHESRSNSEFPILAAKSEQQDTRIMIDTEGASFTLLNTTPGPVTLDGVTFDGDFALIRRGAPGREIFAVGVQQLAVDGAELVPGGGTWSTAATRRDGETLVANSDPPAGWGDLTGDARTWAHVMTEEGETAFPVASVEGRMIRLDRFPVPGSLGEAPIQIELSSVVHWKEAP